MNNNGERDMKSLFRSCTTQIIPALKTESNGIMRMGYVVVLRGFRNFVLSQALGVSEISPKFLQI